MLLMRTTALCIQGSPSANFLAMPVCMWGSPYAYGNPCIGNYACGDTTLDFPYGNISCMHMISD
jgi:hypothetical protein